MKKLAIIGASYLQMPLVLKAIEMGVETHCFAWPQGADCRDSVDFFYPISVLEKEQILAECQKIGIDGICTIASDMPVPTISFVAENMGLIANSYQSALASTDKNLMRQAFSGKVNIPEFQEVSSFEEFTANLKFPIIVKPTDRSGSRGVTKLDDQHGIREAIGYAISESFGKKAIVEEFIEGSEVSVESISWQGEHYILAITDKITTGSPHFVELAHHEPSILGDGIQNEIKRQTVLALDALGIKFGAGHSEFKITSKGEVYAIEVGARMGGDFIGSHLVELSTGYDYVKAVIDVALGRFEKPTVSQNAASGVFFLSEETKSILPYFETQNEFDVEKQIRENQLRQAKSSNDRSGYLIYRSGKRIQLL